MPRLIGLTGYARSGKSTVAAILRQAHAFHEISFAEPIRDFTKLLLNYTADDLEAKKETPIAWLDGVTPRRMMQTLGTEWGRQLIHPEIWIRVAMHEAKACMAEGGSDVVISDVRFANEAKAIREAGGQIWRIYRDITEPKPGEVLHPSESQVGTIPFDGFISNNGTLGELLRKVRDELAGEEE